jgi:hypothetical protein
VKLCDLTVEQYLGITQAWGTGVWALTCAAVFLGGWLWKRRRARRVVEAMAEPPIHWTPPIDMTPPEVVPYDGPTCPVCQAPCSADLRAFALRSIYVRGDWEEKLS